MTDISSHSTAGAAVNNLQLPAAATTAQQAGQQGGAPFRRAAALALVRCHIVLQPLLIFQELLPTDVPRMMANKQHLPLLTRLPVAGALPRTPVLDPGSRTGLAIRECSRITGILQHLTDSSTTWHLPDHLPSPRAWFRLWHRNSLLSEPYGCLPGTSQLLKFLEYHGNCLLHLTIGSLLNLTLFGADESHWHFPQGEA